MKACLTVLVLLTLRHAFAVGPTYGGRINCTYTLYSPTEDLSNTQINLLSVEHAAFAVTSVHARGQMSRLQLGQLKKTFYLFSSAGVDTCVSVAAASIPPTLFSLAPFVDVGTGMKDGQPTRHLRYSLKAWHIGAQVDMQSAALLSLSNPGLYSNVWMMDTFDNTSTIDLSAFAVPPLCGDASVTPSALLNPHAAVQHPQQPFPSSPPMGLLLRTEAPRLLAARRAAFDAHRHVSDRSLTAGAIPTGGVSPGPEAAVDHRLYATPIRDQTSACGGCWAFASVASAELNHHFALKTPSNASVSEHLSVQEVLDCVAMNESDASTAIIDCKGCFGGWPFTALQHIAKHGIARDAAYPYVGVTGSSCVPSRATDVVYPVQAVEYVPPWNATAMALAVAEHGSLVAIINVPSSVMYYTGGVVTDPECCSGAAQRHGYCLQHAVVVVGFGVEPPEHGGTPYWLVRNSFSPSWGEAGHLKIARGSDVCGIEAHPVVPIARAAGR